MNIQFPRYEEIQAAFKGGETDVVALFDKVGQQIVGLAEQPAGAGLRWLIDAEAKSCKADSR